MSSGYSLTIITRYKKARSNTPMWVNQAHERYPSDRDADRSGATFLGRKYNRLRIDDPEPGTHYLQIDPLADDRIGVYVSLLPYNHPGAGKANWRPAVEPEDKPEDNIVRVDIPK